MFKMLEAQIAKPVRNDFNDTANTILNEFGIKQSMNGIKTMKKNVFKSIVKQKCTEAAYEYLVNKQINGSKSKSKRDIKPY